MNINDIEEGIVLIDNITKDKWVVLEIENREIGNSLEYNRIIYLSPLNNILDLELSNIPFSKSDEIKYSFNIKGTNPVINYTISDDVPFKFLKIDTCTVKRKSAMVIYV